MVDSIKITALQDIGANIAYTTLVPVVNMSGTPVTQKSNLQNLGNLILNGAGGSYFPRAAQANIALSVANAAQPNITSVGTLTSLAVTGNITAGNINGGNIIVANFFYGDGGFLTNVAGGGSNYSNSNVAAYLPTYTGNMSGDYLTLTHDVTANVVDANFLYGDASNVTNLPVGNIAVVNLDGNVANVLHGDGSWSADQTNYGNSNVANYLPTFNGNLGANIIVSPSNLEINANGARFIFGEGGALFWPAPGANIWAIEPNIDNEFEIKSTSNIVISTDIANTNSHFTFDSTGIFTAPSNVNLLGSRLNVGPDALNVTSLLNPTLVIANSGAQYIQASIINTDATGSSDWAADGANSSDGEAWSDLGFTGHSFNDANYTITGPGDGYLFVQGYANGIGGHMVLATGDLGAENDIIFATGGFLSSDELARFDHANSLLYFTRTGSGIKFNDDTIQDTAGVVWTSAPVSNTSPGTPGQAAYDTGGNLFVCVATNTWSKFSGTTSW